MTLPATGAITLAMVNTELGLAANAPISLNDPAVRGLAGKPSGAISLADLRGKSFQTILVAATFTQASQTRTGFLRDVAGSISAIQGMPGQVLSFYDPPSGNGFITMDGDIRTWLTGKTVRVNGTVMAMYSPAYVSQTLSTSWQRNGGKFGFVAGQSYVIDIS